MKPDRFERVARKHKRLIFENSIPMFLHGSEPCYEVMHCDDVAQLLRKEHAWMVRMVKAVGKLYHSSDGSSSAESLEKEVLNQLTQRRK